MTLVKAGSSSGKADVIMDVIVIDEISMLTTSALHGVNQALNYVMTSGTGAPSRDMLFGKKSVVAVGDLEMASQKPTHFFALTHPQPHLSANERCWWKEQ